MNIYFIILHRKFKKNIFDIFSQNKEINNNIFGIISSKHKLFQGKEDLLNKEERYKFSKIRRSDALQQLQMKQIETDGTPKRKTKVKVYSKNLMY